ncbi:hypothetical protein AVEN_263671-1 [Araneus ventricosus]|uniref:Uncharacterized protein n=1 Tax=Araneus ventricosus TaxID=182803 RepID=A0A4Y2ART6_ARAVE|nr:hypothetical protein AVEN_263671-1 [Araneus ventricosus]
MFYNIFDTVPEQLVGNTDNLYFVLDGDSLIHHVVWPKQETFGDVYTTYMSYIKRHYGDEVTVVFDGYTESSVNTKKQVVVIGQDVDILVLLITLTPVYIDILMLKEGKMSSATAHLIQATFLFLRVAVKCDDEPLSCSFNLSIS